MRSSPLLTSKTMLMARKWSPATPCFLSMSVPMTNFLKAAADSGVGLKPALARR